MIFAPKRGKEGLSYLTHEISTSSHNQKSIYMNLSCLSFYLKNTTFDSNTAGLSDLILALEEEKFGEKVKECTVFYAETDMIPPVRHYKDLLDIKTDDVLLLISRLQQECGYQTCYIECCELYEFTFPLFALADRILMVGITKEEWGGLTERYMQTDGIGRFKEKCFWIDHNVPDSAEKDMIEVIYEEEEVSYEYGEHKGDRKRADCG